MEEKTEDVIEVQEEYKVDEENVIYREIKEPYGFIYITTNLINGKRYLGQRKFITGWQKYLGSGQLLQKAIKKYGKHNFKRDIILICYSGDELNNAEYILSIVYNVVESDDWYNIVYGGGATNGRHLSDQEKQRLREVNLGKKMNEETKRKISETLSKIMTGRTFSDEHKQHIREARTGLKNPGRRTVYSIELNEIFWGAKAAEDKYGIDNGSICKCCRGICKTIGKHPITGAPLQWKYVDDFVKDDGTVILGAITLGYITQQQVDEYFDNLRQKEID